MRFTSAQQTLLSLLAHNLFEIPLKLDLMVNWSEVYHESCAQTVTLTAFENYKDLHLDDGLYHEMDEVFRKRAILNVRNFQSHGRLHKLMTQAGLPYCVLKGIASAHYYPSPLLRAMGDVDFYVSSNDANRAMQVLEADGFVANSREQEHHLIFRKPGMHFELHREVAGIPDGKAGDIIRSYFADLLDSTTLAFDEIVSYNSPSPFHHGLIMLLHMQYHLLSAGIGLRHLCDWAVFVNAYSEEDFLTMFKDKLRAAGLWKFAKTVSLAASRHLGLPYRQWMGQDADLADALLEDILVGGNFGRKSKGRSYEGLMISNNGKDGANRGRIQRGFASMNRLVRTYWPIAGKLQILYPFGWIYLVVRYLFRILVGKRKAINVFRTYSNSGKRKNLYARLKLYETDCD